jgi:DNA-binding transcriptional regulator LsrR (DeoR family)
VIILTKEDNRTISVDIERKKVRVIISHAKDEEIIKLTIDEAKDLIGKLENAIEDYQQRQNLRID